ncbi:hypothetical protein Tco_0011589 [Tanacetum coccineum]
MADASTKKFLVSDFTNYKIIYSRPFMEKYNELLGVLGRFTQHKMNMDKDIQVSCIIDKLPPSWKDFKHTLKHKKKELTLVKLGSHMRIEKSLRVQDSDKPKGNNVAGLSVVNMVEHNNSTRYTDNRGKRKHQDNTKANPSKKSKLTCWKCGKPRYLKNDCKDGKVGNKANGSGTNGSSNSLKDESLDKFKVFKTKVELQQGALIKRFRNDRAVVRLPDPKLKILGERGIECIFVGYVEHSKAFRFYVIEPNESFSTNSIIKLSDAIFDENRFSSVPRPSQSNGMEISQSHYIEKVPKKFNYYNRTIVSAPIDTSEKLMPNNGQVVSQLEYSRMVLKYLKKTIDYTLSYTRYPLVLEGYIDASSISNTEDNSSTSGWIFLLGGGAISWASKKQTCITSSTTKYEFVALVAAATLANAYSQMYNGKSGNLGVRHNMICELIMKGVVSIEFMRSQQNLVDHLTKGLTMDLVLKLAKGMSLKSNIVTEV